MTTHILQEQIDVAEASFDADARILRNVVLIRAGMSKNRRLYSESVLQAAAPVFEGTKAYDSHQRGERRVSEITGWYTNVRFEGGALRADRHFARTDAGRNVQAIAEDIIAGRAPASLAGLSINAVGKGRAVKADDGDVLEVEAISAANSVDDVTEPAAGGGYVLAAGGHDALLNAALESMSYEEFTGARADYVARLKREWQSVRQDEAVKAAKADADRASAALAEAQATIAKLTAEREAAASERDAARRAAAVSEALQAAKLPAAWRESLKDTLLAADAAQWPSIIEREQRKAESAGHKPRIAVAGAPVMVSENAATKPPLTKRDLLPRDGEGPVEWRERLERMKE